MCRGASVPATASVIDGATSRYAVAAGASIPRVGVVSIRGFGRCTLDLRVGVGSIRSVLCPASAKGADVSRTSVRRAAAPVRGIFDSVLCEYLADRIIHEPTPTVSTSLARLVELKGSMDRADGLSRIVLRYDE